MDDGRVPEHGTKIESGGKGRGKKNDGADADTVRELRQRARDDAGAGAVGNQGDSGVRMIGTPEKDLIGQVMFDIFMPGLG